MSKQLYVYICALCVSVYVCEFIHVYVLNVCSQLFLPVYVIVKYQPRGVCGICARSSGYSVLSAEKSSQTSIGQREF